MLLTPATVAHVTLERRLGAEGPVARFEGAIPSGRVVVHRVLPWVRDQDRLRAVVEDRVGDLRALRHPRLVRLLDHLQTDEGEFLVFEAHETLDLHTLVTRMHARGLTLQPDLFLHLARQLCMAVEALHLRSGAVSREYRITHRALRPEVVDVGLDGVLRLGGAALLPSPAMIPRAEWRVSTSRRTAFLAPEQVSSQPMPPDVPADLFSLGATLFTLWTGRTLFDGPTEFHVRRAVRACAVDVPLAEVDAGLPGLGAVLRGCLRADPAERYADVASFRLALQGLDGGTDAQRLEEDLYDLLCVLGPPELDVSRPRPERVPEPDDEASVHYPIGVDLPLNPSSADEEDTEPGLPLQELVQLARGEPDYEATAPRIPPELDAVATAVPETRVLPTPPRFSPDAEDTEVMTRADLLEPEAPELGFFQRLFRWFRPRTYDDYEPDTDVVVLPDPEDEITDPASEVPPALVAEAEPALVPPREDYAEPPRERVVVGRDPEDGTVDMRLRTLGRGPLAPEEDGFLDLRTSDLRGVRMSGRQLMRVDLQGANLEHADFDGAEFTACRLDEAWLRNLRMRRAVLSRCSLRGADLIGANLGGSTLVDVDLSDADIRGADLSGASLRRCHCVGTRFEGTALPRMEATLLSGAFVDALTYARSGWTLQDLWELRSAGVHFSDPESFPAEVRDVVAPQAATLRVWLAGRASAMDHAAMHAFVAHYASLRPESGVAVDGYEERGERGQFQLRALSPAFLEEVGERLGSRGWEAEGDGLGGLVGDALVNRLSFLVDRGTRFELTDARGGNLEVLRSFAIDRRPWDSLERLLRDLLSEREMRALVGTVTPAVHESVADASVRTLARRGVDATLFESLAAARPERHGEIAVVALLHDVLLPAPSRLAS